MNAFDFFWGPPRTEPERPVSTDSTVRMPDKKAAEKSAAAVVVRRGAVGGGARQLPREESFMRKLTTASGG